MSDTNKKIIRNIQSYAKVSYTFHAGSTITSQRIRYHTIDTETKQKKEVDLSDWVVRYELIDKDWVVVHKGIINDAIFELSSSITQPLSGSYICNIILERGSFVDKEYFIGLKIISDERK